jgi:hypothetical protein
VNDTVLDASPLNAASTWCLPGARIVLGFVSVAAHVFIVAVPMLLSLPGGLSSSKPTVPVASFGTATVSWPLLTVSQLAVRYNDASSCSAVTVTEPKSAGP